MHAYLISLFVLLPALVACGTPAKTTVNSIQIVAESAANQNTATLVDIVFVYDMTAVGLLPKTATEWFDKKSVLINGLTKGIDVVSLQVPPATIVNVPLPKHSNDAVGVYSFSNYIDAAGQPVGNLTSYKKMTLRLMPDSVIYSGN